MGAQPIVREWLRHGDPVSGASSTTYTPTVATGSATRSAVATGTGNRTAGSATITGLVTTTGTFTVGESISGVTIPAGTTIVAVGAGTLTLSQPPTGGNNTSTNLTSGSKTLTGVTTTTGTFAVGDVLSGTGIAAGTKVVAVGAGTLEVDIGVTSVGSGAITGGIDNGRVLQCQVTGTSPGGSLVGISDNSTVNASNPPSLVAGQTPTIATNVTSGPVTVELVLPGGLETFARKVTAVSVLEANGSGSPPTSFNGWSCSA